MIEPRARVVSSFTIIKGSLIEETYTVFAGWDFDLSKLENLSRAREGNAIAGASASWARDVAKVINRRFDPNGRDRALVVLAQRGLALDLWKPLLLWHMTRDEFLVRDFLTSWLYDRFLDGTFRIHVEDVVGYLRSLRRVSGIECSGDWTAQTTSRVASGLLRLAADFGIMSGTVSREFSSYHLPDESFLYLLHAMTEAEPNPRRLIDSEDWHMYLMGPEDVERELLRLHQFQRLHFDAAGSIAHLRLPTDSLIAYVEELTA